MNFYRRQDVWLRAGDSEVVCYRCFEELSSGKFFVQSKDMFWRSGPEPMKNQIQRSEAQLVDLMGRDVPNRAMYDSIEEAIEAHEKKVDRQIAVTPPSGSFVEDVL